MKDLFFSILIPTYKGAQVIEETLRSILSQSFTHYEIIIQDDKSEDDLDAVLRYINDPRIKLFKNERNLGYPGNLESLRKKAQGDILYLMGQDDILGKDALLHTYEAFKLFEDIGAVTRPYYWFDTDIMTPVRAKKQLQTEKDEVVHITDSKERVIRVFETLDQLSGLAYRSRYIDEPFHPDIFPCHIYPFASIFKKHPIVFLKDYTVAVRIATSQSRHISSIYNKSPLLSWVELAEHIFKEEKHYHIRNYLIKDFIAINYVGLVQIRNYAKYKYLFREIRYLVQYRWQNIFSLSFWFFSLGCIFVPPFMLIPMVDWYKKIVGAQSFRYISFTYSFK